MGNEPLAQISSGRRKIIGGSLAGYIIMVSIPLLYIIFTVWFGETSPEATQMRAFLYTMTIEAGPLFPYGIHFILIALAVIGMAIAWIKASNLSLVIAICRGICGMLFIFSGITLGVFVVFASGSSGIIIQWWILSNMIVPIQMFLAGVAGLATFRIKDQPPRADAAASK